MELSVCLKALGDPTRFMIFQQLLIRKHCTRSLSRKLGFTEPTISQHLKILREAGLVYKEKYGYHMHYLPSQEAMDFMASAFEEMRQISLNPDRSPRVCQCEFRQQLNRDREIMKKERGIVRIAVTYDNGQVFQHFGHTEMFKMYDAENSAVKDSMVVSSEGFGHGALAGFLENHQVDTLICGGIGGGAMKALDGAGIQLYAGVEGDADAAVNALLSGTLSYNANPECTHQGEHHHGDGHGKDHDCGKQEGHCCH